MNATDVQVIDPRAIRPATGGGPNRPSRYTRAEVARMAATVTDGMPAGYVLFDVPANRICSGVGTLPDGRSVGRMLAAPVGMRERDAWDNTITVLCVAGSDGSIHVVGKCRHQ